MSGKSDHMLFSFSRCCWETTDQPTENETNPSPFGGGNYDNRCLFPYHWPERDLNCTGHEVNDKIRSFLRASFGSKRHQNPHSEHFHLYEFTCQCLCTTAWFFASYTGCLSKSIQIICTIIYTIAAEVAVKAPVWFCQVVAVSPVPTTTIYSSE